jgi:tRNA threonylcarbamoyladenosine biosynthesis protein TsaE
VSGRRYNRAVVRREYDASDPEQTRALAAELGRRLAGGTLVLLVGPLGAGKTTFAQGLAAGLGVVGRVVSPSFTLSRQYRGASGRPSLVHMDLYRLASVTEAADLAMGEALDDGVVLAIEWPERAGALECPDTVRVELEPRGDGRRIVLTATGAAAAAVTEMAVPDGVTEQ